MTVGVDLPMDLGLLSFSLNLFCSAAFLSWRKQNFVLFSFFMFLFHFIMFSLSLYFFVSVIISRGVGGDLWGAGMV